MDPLNGTKDLACSLYDFSRSLYVIIFHEARNILSPINFILRRQLTTLTMFGNADRDIKRSHQGGMCFVN